VNAPLVLTLVRILSIPVLVIVLLSRFQGQHVIAFAIFLVATITDMLDGFWARRKKQITVIGQLLDPTADKLLIASVLVCLVGTGIVPSWMAVVIIGREIAVTGFRAIASSRGVNIPASVLGKIKMISESVTIALLLLGEKILGPYYLLARIGLWFTVAAAVVSGAEYYVRFGRAVISDRP
jgi:CDP-diacylglycerol--glycerol-3-phosphate 3-phosphatidyltransferase